MKYKNIVFILSDDQGAWSLGSAGNTEIITPNLDKMADSGMSFENFFCASPVCSPARASILTGLLPSAHGVHDWIRSGSLSKNTIAKIPNSENRYDEESTATIDYLAGFDTYTKQLADHGYNCALAGKWHLGDSMTPKHGFSKWYTIGLGGCLYFKPDIIENGNIGIKNEYVTHLISNKAIEYLEQLNQEEKPFYLSVHYTAPHSPWDAKNHPEKYIALYKDCLCNSCPKEDLHLNQINASPFATNEQERRDHIRGYYASITAMDEGIGNILDKLESLGIAENTLVVFTSDNGVSLGHHGTWGKGNATFPMNMYDSSVKVPFIAYQKGMKVTTKVPERLYSHYDLFKTFLQYANIETVDQPLSPGKSFAPLLKGEKEDINREHIYIMDEYGPVRMLRNKEYKYVHRYPYGPHEFYDLIIDPEEKQNLTCTSKIQDQEEEINKFLVKEFEKCSIPSKDATKQAVFGKGQLRLVDNASIGNFSNDFYYVNKKRV